MRLQDKVINNVNELYSFMDGADTTLARKVLGEGVTEEEEEQHEAATHAEQEEDGKGCEA